MEQLKLESEESLKKSRDNMIPSIEKLYDQLFTEKGRCKEFTIGYF